MALAEKGNSLNLDMSSQDATSAKKSESKGEENMYDAFRDMEPRPAFLWGHAVGKNLGQLDFSLSSKLCARFFGELDGLDLTRISLTLSYPCKMVVAS